MGFYKDKLNPEEFIYHFTKLSTALEFILPSKQLRLGLLSKTNDPRENKEFYFTHISNGKGTDSPSALIETDRKVNKKLMSDCKVLCFSMNGPFFCGFQLSSMWALIMVIIIKEFVLK